jgi:hypothetical protein
VQQDLIVNGNLPGSQSLLKCIAEVVLTTAPNSHTMYQSERR